MDNAAAAVAKLKQACDSAYDANPTSCSHAVMAVIRAVADATMEHRDANGLVDYWNSSWSEVALDDGFYLANLGYVVAGGKKEPGHGHVITMYPGDKIFPGGYQYTYKGKQLTLKGDKLYPRSMSTSMGPWPGAMSKGDRTVWDPWANNDKFAEVRFWAEPNIWDKVKKPGAK